MAAALKVAVLCPAGVVSGGPEALHQLAGALASRGVDAVLVHYPAGEAAVPPDYRQYGARIGQSIEDDARTLVVINETATAAAWRFPRARKAIWWLSIDNFFKWRHLNPGPDIFVPRPDVLHLCQSEYARRFLAARGVRPLAMLTDYITEGVFSCGPASGRLACVAFNPKKGIETTRRLMARGGAAQVWLPLEGLAKRELAALLCSVRVYADFGNHPGRDRIPREAALCGAVVVTGRRGAAAEAGDIPLPDRFRLDETAPDFEAQASALIGDLLHSEAAFEAAFAEQEPYRTWIAGNKAVFMAEVEALIAAEYTPSS